MLSHSLVVLSCFPGLLQMWSLCCLLDVSQMWSPSCLHVVSQMWFQAVVSLSGCCFVVFDLSPTCGLSSCLLDSLSGCCFVSCLCLQDVVPISHMWSLSCLLDLVSQILAPGLVVVSLSSTSFPDAVSQLSLLDVVSEVLSPILVVV